MRNLIPSFKNLMIVMGITFVTTTSFAKQPVVDMYLHHAIDEINTAKILITQAKYADDHSGRVKFHYEELLTDLGKIKTGIRAKLTFNKSQPREIHMIRGDYLTLRGE